MEKKMELISTTELCRRLGFTFSAAKLMAIGVIPAAIAPPGIFWYEDDYLDICEALSKYFENGGAMYQDK